MQSDAFYALVDEVVDRLKDKHGFEKERWVLTTEAMKILGIKSKTTLLKLRDTGAIRFSQNDNSKTILYDRFSLLDYIEDNVKEPF
jgi:hypothetical protein